MQVDNLSNRMGAKGPGPYGRLAAKKRRRADEIERGVKPVIVHGWEIPEPLRPLGVNAFEPLVLHTDGRVVAWSPSGPLSG